MTVMLLQVSLFVFFICGPLSNALKETNFTNRIIDGRIVRANQYPFYVFIRFESSSCGGALLSRDLVVTAAHCLKNKQVDNIEVYTNFDSIDQDGPYFTAKWFRIHPKYKKLYFDVGVIKLNKEVVLGKDVKTINLALSAPRIGSFVRIVGYGYTYCERTARGKGCEYAISDRLRTTLTKVEKYSGHVMVARNAENSACFGDSGGPIIQNNTLVGVVTAVERFCTGLNYYVTTDVQSEIFATFLRSYIQTL